LDLHDHRRDQHRQCRLDAGRADALVPRDIGCAFLAVGTALVWAARAPRWRTPLVTVSALFLVAHGALHAYDTLRGALGHDHWWLDLPGVYLPAVVLAVAAARLVNGNPEPGSAGR
jgi:hypothetical protein